MKLSKSEILSIPHLQAHGLDESKGFNITGVSTDTRSIQAGDAFVAIRGEQFDGHNFISNAVEAGAALLILEKRWAEANAMMMVSIGVPLIIVEDSILALGKLANLHRRKFDIPVLAVGGSNGKTTTKEMMRSVLSRKFSVLCTEGNFNNHIGVPQTLFRLEKNHEIAVVEIGINHPGEIEYLCSILEPTHGLLTNIGQEHLEFFDTVENVAQAEGELFAWLKKHHGICFINADDKHISLMAKKLKKIVRYGMSARNTAVKGKILSLNTHAQAELRIQQSEKKAFTMTVGIPGKHNALNALAAATVGLAMKVPSGEIQKALSSFQSASKRMQVISADGITILNDTYNANPDSTTAALETLHAIKSGMKRVAILADMLELGSQSEMLHAQIGKAIGKFGVDILLTYGKLAKSIYQEAQVEVKSHFETKAQLIEYILNTIVTGDVVLVKGSRGMKMEEVVAALTEQFSKRTGV